ncbi:hypothetical protein FACS189450_04960 [Spirochaetia bacterium]|nr:hypothetical protein FACS189450_04960 [Spirochaetia bacterium]
MNSEPALNITAEQEKELFKQMQSAKDKLINANQRLVESIARKYIDRGIPFSELVQKGNIGLIKALEKFDCRKGFKFSAYAVWWIRQAIARSIPGEARNIRVSAFMREQINKVSRESQLLEKIFGWEPTDEEIAGRLGWTAQRVRSIRNVAIASELAAIKRANDE